jgi:hypothetical protein
MRGLRSAAAYLLASSFLVLPLSAAHALTVTFGGGTPVFPPFPGYGTQVHKNNVLDHSGSSVTDQNPDGDTFKATTGTPSAPPITPAMVQIGGVDAFHGYKVDWYYVGAESGYDVTLKVGVNPSLIPGVTSAITGITPFKEINENNQCTSSCGSLHGAQIGPQYLGTSTHARTESILDFSLHAKSGDVDQGVRYNGPDNPAPGQPPVAGNKNASLVFSYVQLTKQLLHPGTENEDLTTRSTTTASDKKWKLVNGVWEDKYDGLWFLFAFNDTGGPDDNHDDFVGIGRVYEFLLPPPPVGPEVPLPAGFWLMGSVLAGAGGIAKWRRRRKASA